MLLTRLAWHYGEDALERDNCLEAISWLVLSLRCCHPDGDPFSGSFQMSRRGCIHPKYYRAVDAVLGFAINSPARLVRASALIHEAKWLAAEAELTQCIRECPNELAAFHLRGMVRGNLAKWADARSDAQYCIERAPDEPIHRFWRAVTTRNLDSGSQKSVQQVVEDYTAFLDEASPGGRKVCDAYFELVVMRTRLCGMRGESKADWHSKHMPFFLDLCAKGAPFSTLHATSQLTPTIPSADGRVRSGA
jgi:hypothetical protein